MHEFIGTIALMDSTSFNLIIVLAAIWSYLLYETLKSWMISAIAMPMFVMCSFIAIHTMRTYKLYLPVDDTINTVFATCVGSVIGLALTCILVRLYNIYTSPTFVTHQSKSAKR